jgi:hypothetical protein
MEKHYKGGSFPFFIRKEKRMENPKEKQTKAEKMGGLPTIDPKRVRKYKQPLKNGTNK